MCAMNSIRAELSARLAIAERNFREPYSRVRANEVLRVLEPLVNPSASLSQAQTTALLNGALDALFRSNQALSWQELILIATYINGCK